MTPERWSQIKDIFVAVIDRSSDERQSALNDACQGDLELEAELRQLLIQHDEMGWFLDGPSSLSPANMLGPGDVLARRYEIIRILGTGGMGEVYEARDRELGCRIAIKVIHPHTLFDSTLLKTFRREVHLARRVTHPNVCRVFDIGREQQQGREVIFLTMELVQGETLAARLRRIGRIDAQEAQSIAVQLCQALGAAHRESILHRDFKCSNVMLVGSGKDVRAVVMDFGIARWIGNARCLTGRTTTTEGGIFGTPIYMSPEQLQGKELSVASDIYSLGLVLYEMVVGARPFQDRSPWAEALRRLTDEPSDLARQMEYLKENWRTAILGCLHRDPGRRFASAGDVIEALKGRESRSKARRRFRPLLLIAALAIAVSFAVFCDLAFLPSLPAEIHIAVLPFKYTGSDPANRAIAGELPQALSENLSRLPWPDASTWVVPWEAVKERPDDDERHAGPSLGANLLLTGNLEKHANHLLIKAELKDANTLRALRSAIIEVPEAEIAMLEDKLLQRTTAMLHFDLSSGILQHLRAVETPIPGAYEFYEQGKGYMVRLTQEDVDQAINLFQKALEKDPEFALAKASLAFAYEWKYRSTKDIAWQEQAREMCIQAMSLNNNLTLTHLSLGMIHKDSGNLNAAIQEFTQAWKLDPANDVARYLLSQAYDQSQRVLEAESLLKDALKHHPASWIYYNDLGAFYYRHSQYNLAEPLFRSATELAPGNPKAFYNLGAVYTALHKYDEAKTVLIKAIAIKPTAAAYSNLGTVLRLEDHFADSAEMLRKAVELGPQDHRLWSNLGNSYALAGNEPGAKQAYQKAVEVIHGKLVSNPRNVELLTLLALNYANLQQKGETLLALREIGASSDRDPETLFTSALAYELVGERGRALTTLNAAIARGLPLERIRNTATLDALRADKRYAKIDRDKLAL